VPDQAAGRVQADPGAPPDGHLSDQPHFHSFSPAFELSLDFAR